MQDCTNSNLEMKKIIDWKTDDAQNILRRRMIETSRDDLLSIVGFLYQVQAFESIDLYADAESMESATLIVVVFQVRTDSTKFNIHVWSEKHDDIDWEEFFQFLKLILLPSRDYHFPTTNLKFLKEFHKRCVSKAEGGYKTKILTEGNMAVLINDRLMSLECPQGFEMRRLTNEEAEIAMVSYKRSSISHVKERLLKMAECGNSLGIFHEETHQLVGWVFLNWDSSISALTVLEEWRRKGLGQAMISAIIKSRGSNACPAFCFIEVFTSDEKQEEREINLRFYEKLGFNTNTDVACGWMSLGFH